MRILFASGFLFLVCFLPLAASAATIKAPANNLGLAGYWSFNEGAGTVAGDSSGRGRNATTTSIGTWVSGKFGGAMSFDGSQNYVSLAPFTYLTGGGIASAATISVWFKTSTNQTNKYIVSIPNVSSGSNGFDLGLNGVNTIRSVLATGADGGHGVSANVTYADNNWHHMVVTYYDDGLGNHNRNMYFDGVQVVTNDTQENGVINAAASELDIGRFGSFGGFFSGSIDDVRVYSRALSASEVANLYNTRASRMSANSANLTRGTSLANGLVGLWTFDGSDITTSIIDRSGNGNNGGWVGGATSSALAIGKLGQALRFDGTNNYVTIGNGSAFDLTSGTYTLSAWIKPDASIETTGYTVRIIDHNGGSGNGWSFDYDNGGFFTTKGLALQIDNGFPGNSTHSNAGVISPGVWQHVVVTANGSTVNFYVNGVSAGSSGSGAAPSAIGGSTIIGDDTLHAKKFPGVIDDVRIYNRTLSAAEVSQLYQLGQNTVAKSSASLTKGSLLSSGLIGLWTFDGKDLTDKVYDRSGQGNNGYVVGAATTSAMAIGKLGQALKFDGVASYVTIGGTTQYVQTNTPFTVGAWVNLNSFNNDGVPVIATLRTDFANPWYLLIGSSAFAGGGYNGINICDGDNRWKQLKTNVDYAPNLGSWHHIVATYNGSGAGTAGNYAVYLDGVAQPLTLDDSGCGTAVQGTVIGSNSAPGANNYWDGKIDDVRIYNRQLSASEVQQLYNLGK